MAFAQPVPDEVGLAVGRQALQGSNLRRQPGVCCIQPGQLVEQALGLRGMAGGAGERKSSAP